jgi:hypothetical protein
VREIDQKQIREAGKDVLLLTKGAKGKNKMQNRNEEEEEGSK